MAGTISLNGYLYGGSGGITDVRVDGESKVSRGVADIDLSPYAKKTATQQALDAKQDKIIAGQNIHIGADGKTLSADDTKYNPFYGTDGTTAGTAGLVPAPATTDANKYLKSDGTWAPIADTYFAVVNGELCQVYDDGQ